MSAPDPHALVDSKCPALHRQIDRSATPLAIEKAGGLFPSSVVWSSRGAGSCRDVIDHGSCSEVLLALSGTAWGQTVNGAITGVVKDASGGVIPDVALTLRNVATDQTVGTTVSGPEGKYLSETCPPAKYEVQATKEGFQQVAHTGHRRHARLPVQRVEITLPVGAQEPARGVLGGVVDVATTETQEHGISPETLQQLPLLMNSGPRGRGHSSS